MYDYEMKEFEDEKVGNLVVGINYLENKKDFDIIKEALKRIYDRLDKAAVDRLHFLPERRVNGERRKECSKNEHD